MAQYGNFQNFTWDSLDQAKNSRRNLKREIYKISKELNFSGFDISGIKSSLSVKEKINTNHSTALLNNVIYAIENNIDTPTIFSEINLWLTDADIETLNVLYWLDSVFLKLNLFDFNEFEIGSEILQKITKIAEQRKQAKINKNYSLADELRNKIKDM
jgi:cysteinyl-tRNA synthetase